MADLTPAEELRAAATRLRAAPTGPARLDDTPIGTCHDCGVAPLDELLVDLLSAREPLAGLLTVLADDMSDYDAEEVDYLGPDDVEVVVVVDDGDRIRPDWTAALAAARALLGAAEQPGGEPAPAEQPVAASTLRPGMVVHHPTWNGGDPVRIVTAHDDGSQMVIRYADVRVRRPDAVVVVPPTFEVTPGAGFEPHTTPSRES